MGENSGEYRGRYTSAVPLSSHSWAIRGSQCWAAHDGHKQSLRTRTPHIQSRKHAPTRCPRTDIVEDQNAALFAEGAQVRQDKNREVVIERIRRHGLLRHIAHFLDKAVAVGHGKQGERGVADEVLEHVHPLPARTPAPVAPPEALVAVTFV